MGPKTKRKVKVHLIEFFIVGLLMGVTEDLLAIRLATDIPITWEVIEVAFLAALPFAFIAKHQTWFISEILVDYGIFRRVLRNKKFFSVRDRES